LAYAVAVNEKICFNRVNPVNFILSELKQRPSGSQFIDLRNGYLPRLPTRCESLLLESNGFLCISIVNAPDSLDALSSRNVPHPMPACWLSLVDRIIARRQATARKFAGDPVRARRLS
jgi:hypothetical protein